MTESDTQRHVILAMTEIWRRTGGIPVFNQVLVQAATESGLHVTVVSLNDRPDDQPAVDSLRERVVVCERQRPTFLRSVATAVWRRRRPLLVLGHVQLAPIGLILRLLRPGLRYVILGYGVEVWTRSGWLRRISLRMATRVAVISSFTAERLVESNGVWPGRIFRLRSVVPPHLLARFEEHGHAYHPHRPRARSGGLGNGPNLLTTGRLDSRERYKGHDRMIRAFPQILRRYPNARYTIVGEGDDRERLEALADEIGVGRSIHFVGFVDDEELDSYYNDCDVFVMPSTGEGFGIVFLEAMLHGKPVVAGNRDGSREPVENGRTGWLVDPDDLDALAAAILDLLDDPEKRAAFGSAGQDRVLQEFTMRRFQDDFDRLLSEIDS